MSANGRGAERPASDFYPTPAWCVRRLLEEVQLPGGAWLDPCAGDGAIIRAARAIRSDVTWHAIEIRAETRPALDRLVGPRYAIESYFAPSVSSLSFDAILTNPPYSLAERFLKKALLEAPFVAMLLRLNFLGSEKRAAFFRENPPDVYVLPNRPSFVRGATDSCEYGWFLWGPERKRASGRVCVLRTTPKSERLGLRISAEARAA